MQGKSQNPLFHFFFVRILSTHFGNIIFNHMYLKKPSATGGEAKRPDLPGCAGGARGRCCTYVRYEQHCAMAQNRHVPLNLFEGIEDGKT